jgi:molecular chaperone HtpG
MTISTQTHKFEAETGQLLDLMISAVYSSKEIFLREIISNASDALDKLRFEMLTNPSPEEASGDPEVRLEVLADERILKVHDNGIGMSHDDVRQNIGVIAKSGTKELLSRLRQMEKTEIPPDMIGQFGVGFYSVFMVAEKVEIDTRRFGETESTHWESQGGSEYTISSGQRAHHGTTVTLT